MAVGLQMMAKEIVKKQDDKKLRANLWPKDYTNRDTGKIYKPHNDDETFFVNTDSPKRMVMIGGEGSGKSCAGIIKTLNRLQNGMSGIMGSPDIPHFRRSLWTEFCRWCPPHVVIERHRHRLQKDWIPVGSFVMSFHNKYGSISNLECGGFVEHKMSSWEGPTVHFIYFDEARLHSTPIALKTFEGRVRIPGPMNEPPQLYFTTTPRKHWLFDYFGPVQPKDKLADFKKGSFTGVLKLEDNRENLAEGYIEERRESLTEAEARVLVDAEWEDISDAKQFIEIEWWDASHQELPPYKGEACVAAIDASKGGDSTKPDSCAIVIVSRHPHHPEIFIPRYVKTWDLLRGEEFDFHLLSEEVTRLNSLYSIIEYAYDPYQLAFWAQTMRREVPGFYKEFSQMGPRLVADSGLQGLIMSRKVWHDGNSILREHLFNANCKMYPQYENEESGYRIRMVKRHQSAKIDAAVALSMGVARMGYYNPV